LGKIPGMENTADLQQENDYLRHELAQKDTVLSEKNAYIRQLEDWIKHQHQKGFGASSEKVTPDQLGLFNEAEEISHENDDETGVTAGVDAAAKKITSTSKPRISIPDHLPREDIVHDLPEEDKVCPHDGAVLKNIGSEAHEQLDIIPAQVKVIRHRRLTYACPCCEQHVVTAKKPNQPIEKSIAAPGLLAYVATQKYSDALPLYRQSEIFKRFGIHLSRQNLANWMIKMGDLVQPLINQLQDHVLSQPVVHMDETHVQVLDEPNRKPESKSYLWLLASFGERPVSVFTYHPTRSASVPLEQLTPDVSTLMVDGYKGYAKVCEEYKVTRLGCWAHARRKFMEAKKLQKKGKIGKPDQALAFIQKLYALEKTLKEEPPDKRGQQRQEKAKPLLDQLEQWLDKSLRHTAPKTTLGEALVYLKNQWPRLIRYVENGEYPIDNNLAENAIRPFAVGRKNWLFSQSQAGAKASANLYSLIQTAKANGLNPYEYLKLVFTQLPNVQTPDDIERLLPWNNSII